MVLKQTEGEGGKHNHFNYRFLNDKCGGGISIM